MTVDQSMGPLMRDDATQGASHQPCRIAENPVGRDVRLAQEHRVLKESSGDPCAPRPVGASNALRHQLLQR